MNPNTKAWLNSVSRGAYFPILNNHGLRNHYRSGGTYHDPCDLGRHAGIYEEPRATIRKIAEDFVEMEHHHSQSLCCGAGGGVRGSYPAHSIEMARRRLAEAEALGPEIVLTE